MQNSETQLSGKEYTVSHTEYGYVVQECHLEHILADLPKGAVVVDIGSGLNQEFARGLKKHYPELKSISIDPTLAISPDSIDWKVKEFGSFASFNQVDGQLVETIQRQRLENPGGDISVAADAIKLPLRNNSVDLVVDNMGPGLYLKDDELIHYLHEVYRVLKPGGEAHISSFLNISNANTEPVRWREQSQQELKDMLLDVVSQENLEFFNNNRNTGLIIKKGL